MWPASRLAALSPTFAVTSWNPAPTFRIRATLADARRVLRRRRRTPPEWRTRRRARRSGRSRCRAGRCGHSALAPDDASLYVGGLFEVYGGLTQHGLIKASPATGTPAGTFNAHLRPDSNTGAQGAYDGEAAVVIQFPASGQRLLAGIAGQGADEFKVLNPTTGALVWVKVLPGDCQAMGVVGTTYLRRLPPQQRQPHDPLSVLRRAVGGVGTRSSPTGTRS